MTKAIAQALIHFAIGSSLVSAQALTGLQPAAPTASGETSSLSRRMEAARPLLGYVTDSSNVLRTVVGSAARPQWGDPLLLPDASSITFLPPRQEYVLLASDIGLSVARLSRGAVYPGAAIPNAMPHPDRVSFSPSGEAAALFSNAESRIEVLSSVASNARVRWSVPVPNPSELLQFALSDDGDLLVATFANQPPVYSWKGSGWQPLSTSYRPDAWTFLPHSHTVLLIDHAEKAIVVLSEAENAPIAARVLANADIDASVLSANKQGTRLLAASPGTSSSWSIDIAGGVVAPLPAKDTIDSLTLLRDGQTFLVSTKDLPLVVNLGSDAQSAATDSSR